MERKANGCIEVYMIQWNNLSNSERIELNIRIYIRPVLAVQLDYNQVEISVIRLVTPNFQPIKYREN